MIVITIDLSRILASLLEYWINLYCLKFLPTSTHAIFSQRMVLATTLKQLY